MNQRTTEAEQVFDEIDGAAHRNRLVTLQDISEFVNSVGGKPGKEFERGINFAVSKILEHLNKKIRSEERKGKR